MDVQKTYLNELSGPRVMVATRKRTERLRMPEKEGQKPNFRNGSYSSKIHCRA